MKLLPVLGKHFLPFQGIPLHICEGTGGNHNKINQRPNAETANSQQIKHAGAHLTHIETMDTEAAKEKAEKEGDPAVVGLRVEVKLFFPFFDGNGLFSITKRKNDQTNWKRQSESTKQKIKQDDQQNMRVVKIAVQISLSKAVNAWNHKEQW